MKKSKKIVYVGMSADILHPGHINILKIASKYGEVVVGLLTDNAIASYKRLPIMSFEERKIILSEINVVKQIIPQETLDYEQNLKQLKPDYVVHGDDWKKGIQSKIREKVIKLLKSWNGQLIEPTYTEGISSTKIIEEFKRYGITPNRRLTILKRLFNSKKLIRILESHNGLTASIVENTKLKTKDVVKEFDAIWMSSLTDSTSRAKPDIEAVDISSRLITLNEVLEVSTKPIIFDADTGGLPEHFNFTVKNLERLGVSGVIIEDKIGLKKNSLFGTSVPQQQADVEVFSEKIKSGKINQVTDHFMIIARIESLILDKKIDDVLVRADAYIKAGADAIMIHSNKQNVEEIFKCIKSYNKLENRKPLIIVPSSFPQIRENDWLDLDVNAIIYANHLLRASYPAMHNIALSILRNDRALEADKEIMSIKQILNLIPGTN